METFARGAQARSKDLDLSWATGSRAPVHAVGALRAHPLPTVAAVLACLLGGLAVIALRTPSFQASAQLLVNPWPVTDTTIAGLPYILDTGDPIRTVETAAAVVTSPQIAQLAATGLGGHWTARQVLKQVAVTPLGQTDVLQVQATASTAGTAIALANQYTSAVLASRRAQVEAVARADLGMARAQLAAIPASDTGAANGAQARVSALEGAAAGTDPTITLLARAVPPATSRNLPDTLVIALALVAGALVGAALAYLLASRAAGATAAAGAAAIGPAPAREPPAAGGGTGRGSSARRRRGRGGRGDRAGVASGAARRNEPAGAPRKQAAAPSGRSSATGTAGGPAGRGKRPRSLPGADTEAFLDAPAPPSSNGHWGGEPH